MPIVRGRDEQSKGVAWIKLSPDICEELSVGTSLSHNVLALECDSERNIRIGAFGLERTEVSRGYFLELIMGFCEKVVLFFLGNNNASSCSFLSRFQPFQNDFGDIIVLSTHTCLLHDLLVQFELDDSHNEIAVVFDFVAKTVVVNWACVVSILVKAEIHVDQLQAFRGSQVELLHKLPGIPNVVRLETSQSFVLYSDSHIILCGKVKRLFLFFSV